WHPQSVFGSSQRVSVEHRIPVIVVTSPTSVRITAYSNSGIAQCHRVGPLLTRPRDADVQILNSS
ncbi:MAG: hypothetical protein OXC80_06945, partial [Gammaproteobacteria bacterium]|nr:hypothetical protein [Gammaproteobacteria bacterium]